jgi:hypothetical protein
MDMTHPGSVLVEGSFDPKSGVYVEWALPGTPHFAEFARDAVSAGRVLHTMTIDQMLEWVDAHHESEQ